MALAVARDGKILWEEGFGLADREKNISATEHTVYALASISKALTATGLMILVERGLIDMNSPINDYLGEAKLQARVGDAAKATVRRVTCHTSGLPLHSKQLLRRRAAPPAATRRDDPPLRQSGYCAGRAVSVLKPGLWPPRLRGLAGVPRRLRGVYAQGGI